MTARSGASARSSIRADAGNAVHLGILRVDQMDPARKTGLAQVTQDGMRPSEPSRGLAPTSATERGANSLSRR